MIGKLAPVLLAALTAISADSASAQNSNRANLKVGVCGIRIIKPAYDGQSSLRAFNHSAGTVIVLQVEYPSVRLIALDKQRSTLDRFVDDEGTDLLVSEEWYKFREDVPVDLRSLFDKPHHVGIGASKISPDLKAAIVELRGLNIPATNASAIQAKGTLRFHYATKQITLRHTNVQLKPGTTFIIGGLTFEIGAVATTRSGDQLAIALRTKHGLAQVAALRFLGAEGKEIESKRRSSSLIGSGARAHGSITYHLKRQVDVVTIEIDQWVDIDELVVPFDVTASVGLNAKLAATPKPKE